jgi:hypothetical protein
MMSAIDETWIRECLASVRQAIPLANKYRKARLRTANRWLERALEFHAMGNPVLVRQACQMAQLQWVLAEKERD